MTISFGFVNDNSARRIGISLGDGTPERTVRIMDNMSDGEVAESLRELADAYAPPAAVPSVLPEWIEAEALSWGRARLTVHGLSLVLKGSVATDLQLLDDTFGRGSAKAAPAPMPGMPPGWAAPAPDPAPSRTAMDLAEWQCVSSALGLAVAMLEGKPIEVIKAAQALAVAKARR